MKSISIPIFFSISFIFSLMGSVLLAQDFDSGTLTDGRKSNNIQTAVPFLLISPDAKAGAMGDVGAATLPDAYANHWNSAKLAYLTNASGISLSYTPWLKNLVPDINFAYLTFYSHLDDRNTIGASFRYFSLGNIELTDINQYKIGDFNPNEFAIDAAISRRFGNAFSLGTALRYIRSSLSLSNDGEELRPASAFAADVSAYFKKETQFLGSDAILSLGVNVSNIGTKMSYVQGGSKYFLPANLKLGTAAVFIFANADKFTLALDFNKLLVPTSPDRDVDGNIISGKDPNRSVVSSIFGSFADAPGGFAEEMREISYSFGTEYWFMNQFAIRAGYFYESPTKGDRQFFTAGTGLAANKFNLDLAYILANQSKSPLANTLRFSLTYHLDKKKLNKL